MYQLELARRGFDGSNLLENLTWYYVYGGIAAIWWVVRLMRRFGTTFDGIS